MAKVKNLSVLNPADKTRMYSVAVGEGSVSDSDDVLVTDVKTFPVGSQFTDLEGKKFYVRTGNSKAVADWTCVSTVSAS